MGVVEQAVEDDVADEVGSPTTSCQCSTGTWLASRCAAAGVAVVEDLEEVVPAQARERSEPPVVEDEEPGPGEPLDELGIRPVSPGEGEFVEKAGDAVVAGRDAEAAGLVAERHRRDGIFTPGRAGDAASRPCGAEAPGGPVPSPAPVGEPATAAGPGTAPPPARRRPAPPATALTVLLAMPSDVAISRWLRPSSYFRRRCYRIFRMDNFLCDTLFLLVSGDLGEDGRMRRYNRFSSAPTRSLQGDRHALESVIGMKWNH